jgi:hypothetical protein
MRPGRWGLRAAAIALAAIGGPSPLAMADPVLLQELREANPVGGMLPNAAFTPGGNARAAHEPFLGRLLVSEGEMLTDPSPLKSREVLGKQTALFPQVDLAFFTVDGDLVPATQDVIRAGSSGRGKSFWDLIVQPGKVWSEPGEGSWSRAAFPFALVNSLEGETHNGLATFAYRGREVTNLKFQIVQQTAPYLVSDYFTAHGIVRMARRAAPRSENLVRTYRESLADRVVIGTWSELAAEVGSDGLEGFGSGLPADQSVLAGLDYRGKFYLQFCSSAAGDLPWCDRARFGVWSATKVLANETALLRLAQKFGPAVFELKIADYVPEAAKYPAWRAVRFEDAIDMATGIGNGSTRREPNDISDGYIDPTYDEWYRAGSESDKVAALLRIGRVYPWGPGQVARYRDQDMFVLGVAMDRYLKSREGRAAGIWSMLEREVFLPIGIHYSPINRTIEADGGQGQPLMAYGYYPTIGDMVKIARLYQNGGRHGETQLLYGPRIQAILAAKPSIGLPTGTKTRFGETYYYNAFWMNAYRGGGCGLQYPVMAGWGGNLVALLPNGSTAIRLAKSPNDDDRAGDPSDLAVVGDRLEPFCPQVPNDR